MYVDTAKSTQNGKVYIRHLLRESYREGQKVKHRTIANISQCNEEEIAAIKLALRHKGNLADLGSINEVKTRQGIRVGAVLALKVIAQRLGLPTVLGNARQGKLALWQVLARLIDQGSRFSAVRLAESHAACDILGMDRFNEDHLYANLHWLAENQEKIERALFRKRYGQAPPQLFLYDVTSSYLEGVDNILAAFGYNRDGKRGKKQLVIGLLAGPDGCPVAVRVFEGNTQDTQTVSRQVKTLAETFGVQEVTMVGDRGMLKGPQIALLTDKGFHYITAITKPQIGKLVKQGVLQLELFDEAVCELQSEGVRYIMRRNPERAKQIARSREDKLSSWQRFVEERNRYLAEHPRARANVASRDVVQYAAKLKISSWLNITLEGRSVAIQVDDAEKNKAAELDGCYVVKTDLAKKQASAKTAHDRYKDLAQVERAFRTCKTGHLEVRPVFVRTEDSTRGHVFVVMLAYLIERELERFWRKLELTVPEGIDELGSLRGNEVTLRQVSIQQVPEPDGMAKRLLDSAGITLPSVLPNRKIHVATRKKLVDQRK